MMAGPARADSKDEDVPSLIKALQNKDAKGRAAAADELGRIGAVHAADAKPAVPLLYKVLKNDLNAGVRKAAVAALGKMDPDPEEAVPAFKEALKDKAPEVRAAAAGALGMLGPDAKDATSALQQALKDKDRRVSRAAGMALRAIQGKKK
jgi:HEAT repeat protein